MIQREQGTTYLSDQCCIDVITKLKLVDMAGPVAAPDASPPAAVSLAILWPRGKDFHGITADATFEGQQGIAFVRYAACTSCSFAWLKLQRIGYKESGGS